MKQQKKSRKLHAAGRSSSRVWLFGGATVAILLVCLAGFSTYNISQQRLESTPKVTVRTRMVESEDPTESIDVVEETETDDQARQLQEYLESVDADGNQLFRGYTSNGEFIENWDDFWGKQGVNTKDFSNWYTTSFEHWDSQSADEHGVLNGFTELSGPDIRDSRIVLDEVMASQFAEAAAGSRKLAALDVGAGVGRVTKELLLPLFHEVDLVEPSANLLNVAKKNLTGPGAAENLVGIPEGHAVGQFFYHGLQQHSFSEKQKYDLILIQWVLYFMPDEDIISTLKRASEALKPDGYIFIKENIADSGYYVNLADHTITRSDAYLLELFERADMQVLVDDVQTDFPAHLFQVRMYVLRPHPNKKAAKPEL